MYNLDFHIRELLQSYSKGDFKSFFFFCMSGHSDSFQDAFILFRMWLACAVTEPRYIITTFAGNTSCQLSCGFALSLMPSSWKGTWYNWSRGSRKVKQWCSALNLCPNLVSSPNCISFMSSRVQTVDSDEPGDDEPVEEVWFTTSKKRKRSDRKTRATKAKSVVVPVESQAETPAASTQYLGDLTEQEVIDNVRNLPATTSGGKVRRSYHRKERALTFVNTVTK